MTDWKQRLGVGYMVGLVVVAVVAMTAIPANNVGSRFLHALIAVYFVGVVILIFMFPVLFVLAAREARAGKNDRPGAGRGSRDADE